MGQDVGKYISLSWNNAIWSLILPLVLALILFTGYMADAADRETAKAEQVRQIAIHKIQNDTWFNAVKNKLRGIKLGDHIIHEMVSCIQTTITNEILYTSDRKVLRWTREDNERIAKDSANECGEEMIKKYYY